MNIWKLYQVYELANGSLIVEQFGVSTYRLLLLNKKSGKETYLKYSNSIKEIQEMAIELVEVFG